MLRCGALEGISRIVLVWPALEITEAVLANLRAPLDSSAVLTCSLEGSGSGIAVGQRIAELHGGRFQIDPGSVGGLEIAIDLPLAMSDAAAKAKRGG